MKNIIKVLGVSAHPLSHALEKPRVSRTSPALRATDYKCPHCFYLIEPLNNEKLGCLRIAPPKLRYALGRTNHGGEDGKYGTSKFHVNPYFNTVTAIQMSNRRQWIAEIQSK